MLYSSMTFDELMNEAINSQIGSLAREISEREIVSKDTYDELADELKSVKVELREYEIAPIIAECKKWEELMGDYHTTDDYMDNYIHMICDDMEYHRRFRKALKDEIEGITKDQIEDIEKAICQGMITVESRWSYMNTDEEDGELCCASFVVGEVEEQIPDKLTDKLVDLTDKEKESCFDNCYSKGSVYFDYSYEIIGFYVTVEAVKQYLEIN